MLFLLAFFVYPLEFMGAAYVRRISYFYRYSCSRGVAAFFARISGRPRTQKSCKLFLMNIDPHCFFLVLVRVEVHIPHGWMQRFCVGDLGRGAKNVRLISYPCFFLSSMALSLRTRHASLCVPGPPKTSIMPTSDIRMAQSRRRILLIPGIGCETCSWKRS